MSAQISPMLAVSNAVAAIEFYVRAFGAEALWHLGEPAAIAGLSIEGAHVFLAEESPEYGTRSPDNAGYTTVRIELFVDDPFAMQARALAAGAVESSPVTEYAYEVVSARPILRMLQGSVVDPFGHKWLIGRFLE